MDMINRLTAAQMNGTLHWTLRVNAKLPLLLIDELGNLSIDERGAGPRSRSSRPVTKPDRLRLPQNVRFYDGAYL
ncbi:MAG: hypothetical protein ACK5TX_13745 [Planctomyces sp.]